jgi:LmbE family N-acetylglucosaminyl deacetylase
MRHVFVAPHYDDIALSCGGAVATLVPHADVWIVTVFGGVPDGTLSPFARAMHAGWGIGEAEAVFQRRREDECAQRALGPVQSTWLEHLDAIYRNHGYDSDAALTGALLPGETAVSAQIAEQLHEFGADEYYVPLGIGRHVDHQLVHQAGQRLAEQGSVVWAYADLPYALLVKADDSRDQVSGVGAPRRVTFDEAAFERKWAAISCYPSQLPTIFRELPNPHAAFERYHRANGDGELAELVWRVEGERR